MKLLNVIPITKSVFHKELSYFSSKKVSLGDLVIVPIRKKEVPAIVTSIQDIKDAKISLKKSDIKLKSIKTIKSHAFLSTEFVKACLKVSNFFLSTPSSTIKQFVPQAILESNITHNKPKVNTNNNKRYEINILQGLKEERLQDYRSLIREQFARGNSVFFCLPTISEIENFSSELQRGIEKYTFILHSSLTNKKIKDLWKKILNETHPVLIIGTSSFLSIPREDIDTIILENENSSLYKSRQRPHIDIRDAVNILAFETKKKVVYGDTVVRTETFHKANSPTPSRILNNANQKIIDMNNKNSSHKEADFYNTKDFSVLSNDLRQILTSAKDGNEKSILFVNRRGHSPTTVCNDCSRVISCEVCESPLVLHKEKEQSRNTQFICHKCLKKTTAPNKCPYCQSWRLKTLGIGTQRIAEEIKDFFPEYNIFILDSDNAKNSKQSKETMDKFMSTPRAILIGTDMLIPYTKERVDNVAVISIDSLFAIPDFKINEKIFRTLLELRSMAEKNFIIQSRFPDNSVFKNTIQGNISGFYKTELESRELFQYPPFKILIKITREDKNINLLKAETKKLEKTLEKWEPQTYSAFTHKVKNIYSQHILLRVDKEDWITDKFEKVDSELQQTLLSLPLLWRIDINPESLL